MKRMNKVLVAGAVALAMAFGPMGVTIAMAQTTKPIPIQCQEEWLRANYGDDWHLWYAIYGCFLIGARTKPVTISQVHFR